MILLQPDYLVFKTANGENIPCSAQEVTVELIGESAANLEDDVIRNAAQAVVHYFKGELKKNIVSVNEFATALEKVLAGLGFEVRTEEAGGQPRENVFHFDLADLSPALEPMCELVFFARLREELHRQLRASPPALRFHGLQGCVKQMVGAKRWNGRCQAMHDQVVHYVRTCLSSEAKGGSCPVWVE